MISRQNIALKKIVDVQQPPIYFFDKIGRYLLLVFQRIFENIVQRIFGVAIFFYFSNNFLVYDRINYVDRAIPQYI
jgi:hypothetical protein